MYKIYFINSTHDERIKRVSIKRSEHKSDLLKAGFHIL